MGMESLGREHNIILVAAGKSVSLKDSGGVTFYCYGANEAFTLKSQLVAGGTATNLAVITRYLDQSATDGTAQWTGQAQAASASITPASGHAVAFYVDAADLPAGAEYAEVVHTSAGLVVAVTGNLLVQRDPAALAALNA